jgi:hypothetical protein
MNQIEFERLKDLMRQYVSLARGLPKYPADVNVDDHGYILDMLSSLDVQIFSMIGNRQRH